MHDEPYTHRQIGWVAIVGLGGMTLVAAALASGVPQGAMIALAAACLMLGLAATFATLRTEVDRETIAIAFGPVPLVRRRWALRSFSRARRIRTTILHGWGIHWVGRGWIYNASGFDAIELERTNGGVTIIGTDDPDGLLAALARAGVATEPPPPTG